MNGWKRVRLEEVAEIIDCPHSTPKWSDNGFFALRNYNLSNGKIIKEKASYVDEATFVQRTRRGLPQKGDTILSREAPIGSIGYINSNEKMCLGQRVVLIKPRAINDKYLMYQLLSDKVQLQFNRSNGSGATVSNLRIPTIKRTLIDLPDIQTQEKIASIVHTYDRLEGNNQKRIKILEEMSQRLYSEWFVKFKFPGYANVKMIKSNRGFGAIPQGWKIELLKDHIKIVRGKSYSSDEIDTSNGKYYLVNLKSFNRNGGFRFDGEKYFNGDVSDNQRLNTGDIVIAVTDMTRDRAVIARPARIPKINHNLVTLSADVVKIVSTTLLNSYLLFLLLDDRFTESTKAKANGANVLHLKPNLIGEYLFVLPPTELMKQFENVVQKNIGLIDCLNKKNDELLRTRDLLIKNIVTGKLSLN